MPYLDHAAATPVRAEVAALVAEHLALFANPSGVHAAARAARKALDDAREEIGALTGTRAQGVVFTSGGTEADNWAVLGVLAARASDRANLVVRSAVEHKAVAEACTEAASRTGATVVVVGVDHEGLVDVEEVVAATPADAALVTVMAANNELGTIQPIAELARRLSHHRPGVVLHTDAVQAGPWLDLAEVTAGAHLVSLSSHKLGGLKGTGVLLLRGTVPLAPFLVGGGQELGHRAGTQDALGAVAMATALRLAVAEREVAVATTACRRDRLEAGLVARAGAIPTVLAAPRLPGHCHVRFPQAMADEVLFGLDRAGVAASAGSSCSSGAIEQSEVLAAVGMDEADARGAVRFTLGRTTTDDEVERAIEAVATVVQRLYGGA